MARAKWTKPARDDLKAIGFYIGGKEMQPSVAAKILREIHSKANEYAEAFARGSVIGSEASELGENCRVFTHKRWVIIFEQLPDGIEILRVLDGNRDYPRLFGA